MTLFLNSQGIDLSHLNLSHGIEHHIAIVNTQSRRTFFVDGKEKSVQIKNLISIMRDSILCGFSEDVDTTVDFWIKTEEVK